MAEHESTMKSYWQSRERFADLFNFLLKEKVVEAEKLSDWGTEFKAMLQSTKRCAASDGEVLVMEDDHAFYILLVVQEGASACLVMPAQAKFYAALIYREQIKKIRGRHRKEKEREQGAAAKAETYLGGYYAEDKIKPVVLAVLYASPRAWSGPRSLADMFQAPQSIAVRYSLDLSLNVLEPCAMSDEDLAQIAPGPRAVLQAMKWNENAEQLAKGLQTEAWQAMDRPAAQVVSQILALKLDIETMPAGEGGTISMGKAVEELLQQAYQKGVKEGYEQGEDEGAITVLKAVLQNLNWSPEQGLNLLNLTPEKREAYAALLKA